jgi:alkylation response protein AidB-like acyl-CoA dehydrogenase
MPALLTDTQQQLIQVAESMASGGVADQRAVLEGREFPVEPTATLMRDFGGLAVPEQMGGDGGSLVDLVVFIEALSRGIVPTPFVHHAAAAQVAVGAGLDISAVVSGSSGLALGMLERAGQRWGEWSMGLNGSHLVGTKLGVPFASTGMPIVVACGNDTVALTTIAGITPRASMDPSLRLANVQLDGDAIEVAAGANEALLRGALVIAASTVGVARGALALGADYAKARSQFGSPIGAFQGIGHMLADAFVDLEAAWSLVLYAAWAQEEAPAERLAAAHAAIAKSAATAIHVAERVLQVHGGIGVTWEADPHLYIRRILALNGVVGGAASHYRALGAARIRRRA